MATTIIQGTAHAPRIALGVALKRTHPGRASIADVAVALNVLAAIIGDEDDAPTLDIPDTHSGWIRALAVVEERGERLIISAGDDRSLRSWHMDGTPGQLEVPEAHADSVKALAVVEDDGARLIISAGDDGALFSWRLDGTPGELRIHDAHGGSVRALAVVEDDGAPLIISGGAEGGLRSWRLYGTPGELEVHDAHGGSVRALAIVEDDGAPLIISAGDDADVTVFAATLHSWRVDGMPGALQVRNAHDGWIRALAVVEDDGAPLIISASDDGSLRSWRLDGTPGELQVPDAHAAAVSALAVVEHGDAPLIISAGDDGSLRSWRLDGTHSELQVHDEATGAIFALAVVEDGGAPLIVGAGGGALRSWRLGTTLAALERSTAGEVEVRELSLGSLEVVVQLPADVLTTVGVAVAGVTVMKLARILDAIKRVAGFAAELRLQRTENDTKQLLADVAKLEAKLEATDRLAVARARHRRRQLRAAGWEFDQPIVVTDDEDDIAP